MSALFDFNNFDVEVPELSASSLSTDDLERAALACVDELRDRGRALEIETERDKHSTARRVIESLAESAREVLRRSEPANDNATGE